MRFECCFASVIIGSILFSIRIAYAADNAVPPQPAQRIPQTHMGIEQLSNEKPDRLLDAKFGMFIHWGLYAVPAKGEWFMENDV